MIQSINLNNVKISLVYAAIIGFVIAILSLFIGKTELFLILNFNGGKFFDFFFKYVTYFGDGLLWILFLLYFIVSKKKYLLPFLICNFAVTTIISQVFKYLILPYEPRPASAITDHNLIHFVDNVTIHTISSFPSGHTATVFVFALIIISLQKNKKWILPTLLYALIVGYSRVYLAQHFPWDLAGGILIVAIPSLLISVKVQELFNKKWLLQ
jgi:membrane-associated phospholipid phosphatase